MFSFSRGFIFSIFFILPSAVLAQGKTPVLTPKVIYGEDGRREIYQLESAFLREIADSTAAMVRNADILKNTDGTVKLEAKTMGDEFGLCSDEPFADQPSAASCSASLVGEDLIATAGHCLTEKSCKDVSFVFGYQMRDEKSSPAVSIPHEEVYACKEVLAREMSFSQDYVLLRLDRRVRNHRVLPLAQTPVQVGDEVYVIGHPSGLPTKYAGGAKVRSKLRGYFVTNLDTYGGNSGSAVFSAASNEIVGILVRGERDFTNDGQRMCSVSYRCEENSCRGEDVTHISYIVEALKKVRR